MVLEVFVPAAGTGARSQGSEGERAANGGGSEPGNFNEFGLAKEGFEEAGRRASRGEMGGGAWAGSPWCASGSEGAV